jgi:hypothetical protein
MMSHPQIPNRRLLFIAFALASGCDPQVDPSYEGEPLAQLRGSVEAQGNASADVGVLWFQSTEASECSGPIFGCSAGGGGQIEDGPAGPQVACFDACDALLDECNAEAGEAFVACYEDCGGHAFFGVEWGLCADAGVGERASVDGDFPAKFTLDLLGPPPAEALLSDDGGVRAAIGYIVAIDPDVLDVHVDFDADTFPEILGGAAEYALLYAPEDISATSSWGQYLGGGYAAGYHLVHATQKDADEACPEGMSGCFGEPAQRGPAADGLATQLSIGLGAFEDIDWPAL